MAMDDNGTGRNYRRRRWVSPVHAIQRLHERGALPNHLSVMKDIDLGHWLDEKVDRSIRSKHFEQLRDDDGEFKLVGVDDAGGDTIFYAIVRPDKRRREFDEAIVTVLSPGM